MNDSLKIQVLALLIGAYLMMPMQSAAQPAVGVGAAPSAVREVTSVIQPLSGSLFFNQQQRTRMDRMRKTGVIDVDGVTDGPAASVLNGFVMRSDGQSAIWVDGQLRHNVQNESVIRLKPSDVGGPSERVKVLLQSAYLPPLAQGKSVSKPATNTNLRKRPAKKK